MRLKLFVIHMFYYEHQLQTNSFNSIKLWFKSYKLLWQLFPAGNHNIKTVLNLRGMKTITLHLNNFQKYCKLISNANVEPHLVIVKPSRDRQEANYNQSISIERNDHFWTNIKQTIFRKSGMARHATEPMPQSTISIVVFVKD